MKMMKWINAAAFIIMIAVNALANLIPIGGNTTAQVSEMWPSLFTPAPYTFIIWGLIYAMMALFAVYQWLPRGEMLRGRTGIWFIAGCMMNVAWIMSWHLRAVWLSLLFIILLFASLMILGLRITEGSPKSLWERIIRAGFDIYTGWIVAAALANWEVLLTKMGSFDTGVSGQIRTIITLLIGTMLGLLAVIYLKKRFSALAIVWAYAGILTRHISSAGFGGQYVSVIIAAIVCIAALCGIICRGFIEKMMPVKDSKA